MCNLYSLTKGQAAIRRRKAKFNPSLTLLPHRRPNDVSWESGNDCFEAS